MLTEEPSAWWHCKNGDGIWREKKKVLGNGKLLSSRSGGQRRRTAMPFQLPENAGSLWRYRNISVILYAYAIF